MSRLSDGNEEESGGVGVRSEAIAFSLVLLLERLAEDSRVPFDRPSARRAVEEAMEVHPGPAETFAAEWLGTAARSIGLRVNSMRTTLGDAASLARPADPIAIIRPQAERSLLIMYGKSWNKVRIWDGSTHWIPTSQLATELGLTHAQDQVDCLIVEPTESYQPATVPHDPSTSRSRHHHGHGGHAGHPRPLRRLWAIMRTESTDLWVVSTFALVVGLFSLATPIAVENLVNTVMFGNVIQPLVVLALTLFFFLIVSSTMRAVQTIVLEILQRRIFVRVVDDLAFRLPRVQLSQFDQRYGPEAVNRFFDTMSIQKLGTTLFLDGTTVIIQTVVGMTILGFYHPWLIGIDLVLIVMVALVIFVIGRGGVRLSIEESIAKYDTAAWLQDLVRCPVAFKSKGASEFAFDRADAFTKRYLDHRIKHFAILLRQIVFVLVLEAVISAVLLGLGGWLVIQGQLTLGQLVAAEMIVTMIIGNIAKLGKHFETFFDLVAALDKVGHLLDLSIEPQQGRYTLPMPSGARLDVVNVAFHHHESGGGVGPISLHVEPGQHVAVKGSPGSGKSTLADLIYGLRSPDSGYVRLDESDMRDLHLDSVRRDVGLVRDVEVFEGTVAENVHLGRSDVLDADVQRALQWAGLDDVIAALPDGTQTRLTRGSAYPLSDSQARQLMLARVLAGRPRLLLVDGLLDSLPPATMEHVADALFEASHRPTVIVMTWRREILDRCEKIFDLDELGAADHGFAATHGGHS